VEAWSELASLHLAANRLSESQFCLEECVMLAPFVSSHHVRLGEVLLTTGDREQAAHHFAMAMKLCEGREGPGCPRAMVGLALATKVVEETATGSSSGRRAAASAAAAGVKHECATCPVPYPSPPPVVPTQTRSRPCLPCSCCAATCWVLLWMTAHVRM
jgi:hypothetical protein